MSTLSKMDELAARAAAIQGEFRSGGTDLMARLRAGRSTGPFVDLSGVREMADIVWRPDGSAHLGALVTVAAISGDARLRAAYPALAITAGALATPQVRGAGTIGGNLLQRNRCWYYRNPHFSCYQSGGDSCPARSGPNPYAVAIDQSACIAPHPSSLAMALLTYDVSVTIHGEGRLPIEDLYGDGSDPTRDHRLSHGQILNAVSLPVPTPGERAAYHRAISRAAAEWPLVEAVTRLSMTGTTITSAAVAVGGVARTPLRLPEVEAALLGREATPEVLGAAADRSVVRCRPPAQAAYKVGLLRNTTLEVLERAAWSGAGA